ncbi:MAG: adenosine deaminase [Leptospiraceae bacterium]|nr:adenosine deaminase [Leptospiraceae bacterium]
MKFAELHSHLYGCLTAEELLEIGKKNPSPRWQIYNDLHEKLYSERVPTENFFQKYGNIDSFKGIYNNTKRGNFLEFQLKFNLVIALVKYDIDEIRTVAKNVSLRYFNEGSLFNEFRIMFSPYAQKQEYEEKTIAACEGFAEVSNIGTSRLIVSLHRDGDYHTQYRWLKELSIKNKLVQEYLVGIDFCSIEEGFPPEEKSNFFKEVLKDNLGDPTNAYSILYHVGESFSDKTPHSACRWVIESSKLGAHRLGHCIALGVPTGLFLGKVVNEDVEERRKYLKFIIENYFTIRDCGEFPGLTIFEKFLKNLEFQTGIVPVKIDQKVCIELETVQNFGLKVLRSNNTVIETCPTSNMVIAGLDPENLPIKKFIKYDVPLTVGSDDPGILDTNLKKEYGLLNEIGIKEEEIDKIRLNSPNFSSEILSGRKKNPKK